MLHKTIVQFLLLLLLPPALQSGFKHCLVFQGWYLTKLAASREKIDMFGIRSRQFIQTPHRKWESVTRRCKAIGRGTEWKVSAYKQTEDLFSLNSWHTLSVQSQRTMEFKSGLVFNSYYFLPLQPSRRNKAVYQKTSEAWIATRTRRDLITRQDENITNYLTNRQRLLYQKATWCTKDLYWQTHKKLFQGDRV